MEDRKLPITVGQGAGARVVTLDLPRVHADRRHHPHRPAHHAAARPLRRDAPPRALRARRARPHRAAARPGILGVEIDDGGRRGDRRPLARHAARGQPAAQARARLRRGPRRRPHRRRDVAREALDLLEVDAAGLDRLDREILRAICEKFGGGPVGLSTLAVAVGEESDTIEDVYEPYLLQQGLSDADAARPRRHRRAFRPPRPRAAARRLATPLLTCRLA